MARCAGHRKIVVADYLVELLSWLWIDGDPHNVVLHRPIIKLTSSMTSAVLGVLPKWHVTGLANVGT